MMSVPSSGQLSLLGIAREKKYGDYYSTSPITGPISLYDLVNGGNSHGSGEDYDVTNTLSPSYPSTTPPYILSDWHGYNHNAGVSCASYTAINLYPQTSLNCDTSKPSVTRYIDTALWADATVLLIENAGNCILAPAGWYYCGSCSQNGTEVRYWDGNSFTSSSGCP